MVIGGWLYQLERFKASCVPTGLDSTRRRSFGNLPLWLTSARRRAGDLIRPGRRRLPKLPDLAPNPPLGIAGRSHKIVLQPHLGQPAIARLTQAVRPD